MDLNFSSEKKPKLDRILLYTKKMGGLKPPVLNLVKIYLNGGAYKIPP